MLPLRHPFGRGLARCTLWALAAAVICAIPASAADPDALWNIVHRKCVPDQRRHHRPAPCERVDLHRGVARGYVVLKDIVGPTQFLVMPTVHITGIESPRLLAPGAPNYWEAAWEARPYVFARANRPLPRDAISLAVNSAVGRSQNQLHIHVDCVRPDVREYVVFHSGELPPRFTDWTVHFDGHRYWAMRLDIDDLRDVDPFTLLARGIPGAYDDMGSWTLVVVGIEPRGFVVFAGHVDPAANDRAAGEELQDHGCALAQLLPP
jgi:CDP-diacylglycerol pyrophosphatase